MDGQIMLINVLDYEKDGKTYSHLKYVLVDKDYFNSNTNYIGFVCLDEFINKGIRSELTKEDIGIPLKCEFKKVSDYKNPLNSRLRLISITKKDGSLINWL